MVDDFPRSFDLEEATKGRAVSGHAYRKVGITTAKEAASDLWKPHEEMPVFCEHLAITLARGVSGRGES